MKVERVTCAFELNLTMGFIFNYGAIYTLRCFIDTPFSYKRRAVPYILYMKTITRFMRPFIQKKNLKINTPHQIHRLTYITNYHSSIFEEIQ